MNVIALSQMEKRSLEPSPERGNLLRHPRRRTQHIGKQALAQSLAVSVSLRLTLDWTYPSEGRGARAQSLNRRKEGRDPSQLSNIRSEN